MKSIDTFFDWILWFHFIPFQKWGKTGLHKIVKWVVLPFSFYGVSIIFYLSQYFPHTVVANPIGAALIVLIIYYLINRGIGVMGVKRENAIWELSYKYNGIIFKIIGVFFGLIFYVFSVITIGLSFKFFF